MQENEGVWTCEDKKNSREPVAPLEIGSAIEALSHAQLLRLRAFATWRMRAFGGRTAGLSSEDLLSEAIISTLSGRRNWKEGVPFFYHLRGAIRSISTAWRVKLAQESLVSELPEELKPDFLATHLEPERVLSAKEQWARIRDLFKEDFVALQVLEQLGLGHTSKEIQEKLHLQKSECAATVKRIRRKLQVFEAVS